MIRTKNNSEALDEIESENIIPFKQAEIADEVRKIAAELGAVYNCENLSWQELDSDQWSIEFCVGEEEEAESIMLLIRGGEPKEVFAILVADLNTRLIDCSTGEFFLPGEPTSFEKWKAYRDKIVKGQ
ncbi:MAG: hypothetical protein NC543_13740 [bacterium]|nr:hypothetical protein [bacterium]MCM1376358.1 hypothetical protein [Muribaculum sp.]